jgi:hypothetical protein
MIENEKSLGRSKRNDEEFSNGLSEIQKIVGVASEKSIVY